MNHETFFSAINMAAIAGWLLLATAVVMPPTAAWRARLLLVAGRALPLLLCAVYVVALTGARDARGGGDFNSLAGVMQLFASPPHVLAAWTHFLAFDLLVGRWIVDDATARGVAPTLVLLCLFPTLMYGPLGLLVWLGVRAGHAAWLRARSQP